MKGASVTDEVETPYEARPARRRGIWIVVGIVGTLAVIGVVAVVANPFGWKEKADAALNCGDSVESLDPAEVPGLEPWADLDLSDASDDPEQVRGNVEALPFGKPVAGIVELENGPTTQDLDDGFMFARGAGLPGTDFSAALLATDSDGAGRWALATNGYGLGGGSIADTYTTARVAREGYAEIVSFGLETGERVGCTRLGGTPGERAGWDPSLAITELDDDIVAAYTGTDDELELARLSTTGDIAWQVPTTATNVKRIDVAGDAIALSTWRLDEENLVNLLSTMESQPPRRVQVHDSDGSPQWQYPQRDDEIGSIVGTVETGGSDDAFLAMRASLPDGWQEMKDPAAALTLEALSPMGKVLWSHELGERSFTGDTIGWDATVLHSLGGSITALDGATGDSLWRMPPSKQAPGDMREPELTDATSYDDRIFLPYTDDGGAVLDLDSGDQSRVAEDFAVNRVHEVDGHVLVELSWGVVLFER